MYCFIASLGLNLLAVVLLAVATLTGYKSWIKLLRQRDSHQRNQGGYFPAVASSSTLTSAG
jgi:hypothetical protein